MQITLENAEKYAKTAVFSREMINKIMISLHNGENVTIALNPSPTVTAKDISPPPLYNIYNNYSWDE